jgi:anaerobic selenocysteine-containing dehydrogenase
MVSARAMPPLDDQRPAAPATGIATTTCYMCACRCGIRVHLKDGQVRYIDGNPDHPVNKGVLCAKGSAGIMQHLSPARLRHPMRRVGPRGSGAFEAISWDEALAIVVDRLSAIRANDPKRLAFFTGRDQSQSLTGWWAKQFGTPNFAAHGGFCSVNMAAAGMYSFGGSFWEFGEPDFHHTRYFILFGVAEDHSSNPLKIALGDLKTRGQAKFLSVNPVRTGYSAIADEWLAIRPGTDGLLVGALIHELLRAGRVDLDYLVRYTNAPWLVVDAPGTDGDGLFARDAEGRPLCFDRVSGGFADATAAGVTPALTGRHQLPDGRWATPVMARLVERFTEPRWSPAAVADQCGVPAADIARIAVEIAEAAFAEEVVIEQPWTDWAGRRQERMVGRPVSMHAMRGISAHSNGFQTCRLIHLLQILLGSIDAPGGFRYKPPFPRTAPPGPLPAGKADQIGPGRVLAGMPLGFPLGPEDLLIEADGAPVRIDEAYSWTAPLAAHGMMHMVIRNAWAGEPYKIDTLFMYMANMAWNSSMNSAGTMAMLTDKDDDDAYKIPFIVYADAYASETVAYADLVLPDTTYLERWDCISLLDRPISDADGVADAIRRPVVAPDRDVRPFQDVLIDLGARLGLPGFVTDQGAPAYPGGYADYLVSHQRSPGIGPLGGWRGDGTAHGKGAANPDQLRRYIDNGCFWRAEIPPEARYFRFANRDYFAWADAHGLRQGMEPLIIQIWSEPLQKFRLAGQGLGPRPAPTLHRARLVRYFDPLPDWHPALEAEDAAFPLRAVTQRPMAMYHAWGSQNAWLRQIHAANRLFMARATAAGLGVDDDGWVWIESRHGRVRAQVKTMEGVEPGTVWTWNAIGKRAGAWGLDADAPEATRGFLLNHLIDELLPPEDGRRWPNSDPVTGQAAWYDLRVRVVPCAVGETGSAPAFTPLPRPPGLDEGPTALRYGGQFQ